MRRIALLGLLLSVPGCGLDPYCLECDPGALDGSVRRDGEVDDASRDAARADGASDEDAGPCIAVDGGAEECNERDDDCDGNVDEDFDLSTSPLHCGACNAPCLLPNAEVECRAGECFATACLPGFADLDRVPGCEYRCPVFPTQAEDCNGFDDDCDGTIDDAAELPPAPAGLCRTTPGTPCAGVATVCATREGRTTWFCDYPAAVEFDPRIPNGIALDETRCDGLDGDCDGLRDESFAELGNACDNGERGACRDAGEIACDPADATRTRCDLSVLPDAVPGAPLAETCNAIDDDCDGTVDDADPTDPTRVVDDMVHVVRGGLDFWIYRYEASRPDSTPDDAGDASHRACSSAMRLPWSLIGYDAAAAACAAAGHRLCTAAEWVTACEGATSTAYPYGASYDGALCNGADRDAVAGGAIDSRLEPCGTLASCASGDGALDMSGNLKEWTDDARGTSAGGATIYVVRGGSYESPRLGLSCQTDLSRATEDTILGTLGFRCCDDDGP